MKNIKVENGRHLYVPTKPSELIVVGAPDFINEDYGRMYIESAAPSQLRLLWSGLFKLGYVTKQNKKPSVDDLVEPFTQFLSTKHAIITLNHMLGPKKFRCNTRKTLVLGDSLTRCTNFLRKRDAYTRDVLAPKRLIEALLEFKAFDLAREHAFAAMASDSIDVRDVLEIIEEMEVHSDEMASVKEYAERVLASLLGPEEYEEKIDTKDDVEADPGADTKEEVPSEVVHVQIIEKDENHSVDDLQKALRDNVDLLNECIFGEYSSDKATRIEEIAASITSQAWQLQELEDDVLEAETAAMESRSSLNSSLEDLAKAQNVLDDLNPNLAKDLKPQHEILQEPAGVDIDQLKDASTNILSMTVALEDGAKEEAEILKEIKGAPSKDRAAIYQKVAECSGSNAKIEELLRGEIVRLGELVLTGSKEDRNQKVVPSVMEEVDDQKDDGGLREEAVIPSGAHTPTSELAVVPAHDDDKDAETKGGDVTPVEDETEAQDEALADINADIEESPAAVVNAMEDAGRLMQQKWPGLAAFTIGAAADLYPESMTETPPSVYTLAAYAWMRTQYRDNLETITANLAEEINEYSPDPEWANGSDDRALLMALLAGVMPFHLRHRNTKLSNVVRNSMTGRFGNAGPLHELCEVVSKIDTLNVVVDLEFLSSECLSSSWDDVLREYIDRAGNWLEGDDVHRRISFPYAQEVWIKIATTKATSINAALKAIAGNSNKALDLVSQALSELRDPYNLIKSSSREKIVSHSRRHLEENIEATKVFFIRVKKHLESNPADTMIKNDLRVDGFLEDLKSSLKKAKKFLSGLDTESPIEEGARAILFDIVDVLCEAADGNVSDKAQASIRNLLSCEFMLVDGLTYVGNTRPLPDEHQILLEGAADLSKSISGERAEVMSQVARKRLESYSILPAQALARAYRDVSGDKKQFAQLEALIDDRTQKAKDLLSENVHRTENRINMSAAMNLIDEGDRRALDDQIMPCAPEMVLSGLPSHITETGSHDSSIVDFPQALDVVEAIDRSLDEILFNAELDIKQQVEGLAEKGTYEKKDIDRVLSLVDQKDILTAREYISILKSGETLTDSMWKNDALNQFSGIFLPKVAKLYENDERSLIKDLIAALEGDKKSKAFTLIPETLKERGREEAATILNGWISASPIGKEKVDAVASVAERGLGFGVLKVTPELGAAQNSASHSTFTLASEVVSLAGGFVPPHYGSFAAGKYQVIVLGKSPSVNSITQHLAGFQQRCGIIFARCLLTPQDRRTLAKECRHKPLSGLVVDEAMMAFLVLRDGNHLADFFHVAVPYAATSPYGDPGTLPEEMFYGRSKQRHDVINPMGGSLVYGGRRLGKTALLNNTKSRNDAPDQGKHVAYINIETVNSGAPADVFWSLLSTELKARKIINRNLKKPESIVREIVDFLDSNVDHSLLMLFDEADAFIESEEERDYENIRHLSSLMEKSARRFRFVMAGLHNSQRAAKKPNNPLARLGAPIFIGPFTDADRYAGLKLITEPMAVMGYEFEDQALALRILSQSNYYPVLIHIYCEELLKILHLEKSRLEGPPFIIRKEHLDKAYDRKDFHEEIRRRFRLTLELDDRYYLIALIIAMARFEQVGDGQQPTPLRVSEIRDRCINYGRTDVLGDTHTHAFNALLDEMKGLGVLQYIGDGYVLRSANVAMMIGSESEVMDHLANFSVTTKPKDRSTERRCISADDQYRRSPLTSAQEYNLLYSEDNPISVLFGNGLTGVDEAMEVLRNQIQQSVTIKTVDRPMVNAAQFLKTVTGWINREGDDESVVFMIMPEASWNIRWLRAIGDIRRKLISAGIRILFFGNAFMAKAIANEGGVPDGISVESIVPWSKDTLSFFLKDVGRMQFDNPEHSEVILSSAGMIGSRITDIIQKTKLDGKNLNITLTKSMESAGSCQDVLKHFGLDEDDRDFVSTLTSILPVSQDEIRDAYALVEEPPIKSAEDLTNFCEWSGMMHLTTDGDYDINPLLKRCFLEDDSHG